MKRIPAKIRKKAQKIKLLLLDVDGVLTDGQIVMDDRGQETKQFYFLGLLTDLRGGYASRVGFRQCRLSVDHEGGRYPGAFVLPYAE